tara:strand:+ start:7015 stop:7821 length:807 start_codon:yes stop_codon:yes gene_type:complete
MKGIELKKIWAFLILMGLMSSCAQKFKRNVVLDPLKDSLRKESLMRYSDERLRPYLSQNSPYKDLSSCHKGIFKKNLLPLKRKVLKDPKNTKILNELGVCYYLLGQLNLSYYHLSLGLTKTSSKNKGLRSKLYNNKGLIYLKWKNYKMALLNFKKALKEDKHSFTAHYNVAQLYLKFGDFVNALSHLYQIPNAEEDSGVIISKAYAHILKKEFKSSLNLLNKLEKKEAKREDVKAYKEYLNFKLGKAIESEEIKSRLERLGLNERGLL